MSKNKFYCPALYYKLVVDSKPAKPGEVAKVTYKISVGANNSIGKNLKLNSKDGNSIELSNVTQKTKVCSFSATIKIFFDRLRKQQGYTYNPLILHDMLFAKTYIS